VLITLRYSYSRTCCLYRHSGAVHYINSHCCILTGETVNGVKMCFVYTTGRSVLLFCRSWLSRRYQLYCSVVISCCAEQLNTHNPVNTTLPLTFPNKYLLTVPYSNYSQCHYRPASCAIQQLQPVPLPTGQLCHTATTASAITDRPTVPYRNYSHSCLGYSVRYRQQPTSSCSLSM
jgi:hypothetical protein